MSTFRGIYNADNLQANNDNKKYNCTYCYYGLGCVVDIFFLAKVLLIIPRYYFRLLKCGIVVLINSFIHLVLRRFNLGLEGLCKCLPEIRKTEVFNNQYSKL